MTPIVSDAERRARLARRHLLADGAQVDAVADVASALVGLHSSDPVTVFASTWRRTVDPSVASVERALYEQRSVLRQHAMRRTLWVVTPELAPVVHAASTRALVAPDRRRTSQWMVESGVAADDAAAQRWIDAGIAELLAEIDRRGETTARELGDALPHLTAALGVAVGKSYGGTVAAHTRLLTVMGLMGLIVRGRPVGSWINAQYRWATTARWLGSDWPEFDTAVAQRSLVEMYLRAFGPVTTTDVQWWAGWTKGATTKAIAAAGADAVALDDGTPAWVAAGDTGSTDRPGPWIALLPSLDPTVMGWKQRAWYLPSAMTAQLFDTNGNAGPTVWADGQVVGAWGQRADGTIAVELLAPVPAAHRRMIDAEAERLCGLVGETRFSVRFQSPLGKALAGRVSRR